MSISDARSRIMQPDNVINLNPGSCSPVLKQVFSELTHHVSIQCSDPTEFTWTTSVAFIEKGRSALAAFLHCDPSNLILCTNASQGINSILQTFSWQPGDEILTTDQEYHHYQMLFKVISKRFGINVIKVRLPLNENIPQLHQEYCDLILNLFNEKKSPSTKAIFFSHVTSPTGLRLPAEELCDFAKKEQIVSIIDGAHGPGQIPVSLRDIDPDFYVSNLHKWMMNPAGCGFIYAAPAVRNKFKPLIIMSGYGALIESTNSQLGSDPRTWTSAHEYLGTSNLTPMTVLWKTIDEFNAIGLSQIQQAWQKNRVDLINKLQEIKFEIVSPLNPDCGSCLVSARIPVPGGKIDTVKARHAFRNIHKIEMAFPSLEDGTSLIRVSAAWFVTCEQIDYLLSILKGTSWKHLRK